MAAIDIAHFGVHDLSKWLWLSLFLILQGAASAAHAGAVAISRLPGNELQLVAEDATIDEVLARLAEHEGFAIAGGLQKSTPRRLSVRLRGSLDDLLVRLMRNESFSLVFSASAPGRIERIVLLGAQAGRVAADEPATREVRKGDGGATSGHAAEPAPEDHAGTTPRPAPRADSLLSDALAQGVPVPTADAGRNYMLGDVPTALPSTGAPATQGLPTPSSSVEQFSGMAVPTAGVGNDHASGSHPK